MPKKLIIKRYGNRRLYNSDSKSYVKLRDIAEFIRQGSEIQVLDSRTGEDITKLILTQIILEEEKSKKDLLPISFLYDLIRHQQGWVQEFFRKHIAKALESYFPAKTDLVGQIKQSLDFRSASGLFERILSPKNPSEKAVPGEGDHPVEDASSALEDPGEIEESPSSPSEDCSGEATPPMVAITVSELLNRLATMEQRLSHLETRQPEDEE